MIVDPDFFGHWKTQMLIGLTQQEPSPLYVIKLWAFCQQRREYKFENMHPVKLAAICGWKGDPDRFLEILLECEFVHDVEGQLVVHEWDVVNYVLVRNWKNGKKGGRPKGTQQKPTANPQGTQQKPTANPARTDRIRLDRNKKKVPKKNATATPPEDFAELIQTERFQSLDTPPFQTAYLAFVHHRLSLRKKITRRAVELHLIDALKVGPEVAALFMIDAEKNGWTGWYFPERVEEYREKAKKNSGGGTRPSGFTGS